MAKVSASLLACDYTRIGEQVLEAQKAGADILHIDIMDGVYEENLSFGPQLLRDLKKITDLPLSVHFETARPDSFFRMFLKAGADYVTFQLDACPNPIHFLREIRSHGLKAGLGFGPAYPVDSLRYLIHHVDGIILMSVEPGYGGQKFEESVYEKIRQARKIMEETGHFVPISIDGGVDEEKGRRLTEAGADILVAGSYVFGCGSISESVKKLKAV